MKMEGTLNEVIAKKLDIIAKLLYIQNIGRVEEMKGKFLKTEKQKKIYSLLNGRRSIQQIAKSANCSVRLVRGLLPEWERAGFILGFGKGAAKKYCNLENLEV